MSFFLEQGGHCCPAGKGPRSSGFWRGHASGFGLGPALFMLLVYCTGCASQPILYQPPSASSFLGTTIHLICTLSSDHDINIYSVYWYQQRPDHPPRFLLRYFSHSDKHYGSGISPRFSGSKSVARNQGYLSISELQPEDEAMYFCAVGVQRLEEKEMEKGRGQKMVAR